MTDQSPASERATWRGRLLIVTAAVLWSTSGFFAKAPWFDGWPEDSRGLLLAFFRSLFASVVLIPLIRHPVWRWQMIPMVVCFAGMVWSFMSAMVHGPAANAIWLQYLCPAWVLIIGVLVLKESVSKADLRMFGCCLGGVLLILTMELGGGGTVYATSMGLLSGITFAGVLICMRSMRDVDPAWLITLNHVATWLILLPGAWQAHRWIPAESYVALGFFGIVQMSIPYVLFARGLRTTTSPEASILTLIEPILVPVWVFLAWHHHANYQAPHWWTWAGGGLIMVGLLSRYVPLIRMRSQNPR